MCEWLTCARCVGLADQEGPEITLTSRLERAAVMDNFDGTITNGRKGIAYDWQSLYAAAEAATIDCELAALVPALAE